MIERKYKEAISLILKCDAERIFLYWKGRVALYAILKAMGIKKDDEVILPAFTCVVVPNAIIYLGAKPVYVDISTETLNMEIDLIEDAITPKTKVIICQNTFGLSSNIEEINEIAKKHKLFTIEDCTHGFGGVYNGKPNGSYCDAAFYSTQWNKPFSTGIGGFAAINNLELLGKMQQLENEKLQPSIIEQFALAALIILKKYFINRFTYWSLVKLYRFLSNKNLIIGSNQGEELSGITIPKKYFKDISLIQIITGIKELKKNDSINNLRQKNATAYTRFLMENGKTHIAMNFFENHLFLRYPVLVENRESFLALAEKSKISVGDWFLSPIHPVKQKFDLWKLNMNNFPIACSISQRIVNLPTDIKDNREVLNFLNSNLEMIK
ncbi:MAG: aminotransferase class I/II-fold pyridoxal phosphate-dependent enzyme [Ignavibacteria bacterium]|nr:aminotransferase class I/II-fold pyridoxal phosphate-dependent enzyme [Ignavibacteria bacterium]